MRHQPRHHEVGLRDDLQSVQTILRTEWVIAAHAARPLAIKVGSFVSARLWCHLADIAADGRAVRG